MSTIFVLLKKAGLTTLAFAALAGTSARAATFISFDGVNDLLDPAEGKTLFVPPVSSGIQTFAGSAFRTGEPPHPETLALLPVPEPTTWAMMFVGFGSIGLIVRSRSRRMAKFVSA